MTTERDRLRGVFFGQLVGDALGTRYEFKSASATKAAMATDTRADGFLPILGEGPFTLTPGQITDDSELALSLSDSLLRVGGFEQGDVACAYVHWCTSNPPDIGSTTVKALTLSQTLPADWKTTYNKEQKKRVARAVCEQVRVRNGASLSNGSLMRQSPLAVVYRHDEEALRRFSREDTQLTHVASIVLDCCVMHALALARLIRGETPENVVESLLAEADCDPYVKRLLTAAKSHALPVLLPDGQEAQADTQHQGFIGVAFQSAFYELLHAASFEEGLRNAVGRGGDTDTTGCITASLLGARFGEQRIPAEWRNTVQCTHARVQVLPFLDMRNADTFVDLLAAVTLQK